MLLDLNARRAARAAGNNEPFVVSVGDPPEEFTLVNELPLRAVELAGNGELVAAVKLLVADQTQWDRFAELISLADVNDIISQYGASTGESSASIDSSANAGESSGPTSDVSTDSTSPTAATDPPPSTP